MGEVNAVWTGRVNDDGKVLPMTVKFGQKVMYKKWGGTEVKVEGKEWLLVEEKDVMAVVEWKIMMLLASSWAFVREG